MNNAYRAFRQFERLLFRGVPEQPEPNWQREFHSLVPIRHTGKSQLLGEPWGEATGKLIAEIIYRPDVEEIECVYTTSKGSEFQIVDRSDSNPIEDPEPLK